MPVRSWARTRWSGPSSFTRRWPPPAFTAPKPAAYSLSNYVMGSVVMQVTWQDRDREGAGEFLRERADRYPALAEHGLDHAWDATFDEGLGYLLDGMEQARHRETGRLG
ncbi:hypothetical protein [Nonomuraea sp. NPDC049784]|uniref:hypothetical protein n=1 Tax=Nonomuraea sp. NPDC049784 TaxID=3154361 RepID=UPI0033E6AEBC